ncbi:efflux RND transporter periplasmic adaptor subunit [Rhodocytophaga aerolata]|uniref:Efflux RND transporter periplasmic adaptor subunit n=1 Tax=Rhodocytophaga aerolata TaxID=455078 RepID=A0ABT8RBX8_9BACT|nr:efflux RND transporter periplasmic adaptor subunit [Rhodocytophaga aerolata]MDO1449611.1 efflux RND transporter periplasmic adaptor subunit [Rhodocytophaga aerolata]
MKKISFSLKLVIPLLYLLACNGKEEGEKKQVQSASVTKADTVHAFILTSQKLSKEITLPGELKPYEQVSLVAKVSGFVKKINVDIGSEVKKGQILAILEAPEMDAQLAEVNSRLQATKAKYTSSLDTYTRIQNASKKPGVIAPSELERTKNVMHADSAEYESMKALVRSKRSLDEYLIIRAPFDGVITMRHVHPGALVGANNSQPLLEMENNKILRLAVAVPEATVGNLLTSKEIFFTVRAFPGKKFPATLARKTNSVVSNNRTELWEFDVSNQNGQLKPGMFADVKINMSRPDSTFLVPSKTVVTSQERNFIVRIKNRQTEWVDVSKGMALDDKIEIFGNVSANDTLAQNGSEELKPDKRVVVRITEPK